MSIVKDLHLAFFTLFFLIVILCQFLNFKRIIIRQREYFVKTLSNDFKVSVLAQLRGLELITGNRICENEKEELLNEICNSCKYTFDMINMLSDSYRYEQKKIIQLKTNINLKTLMNKISFELNQETENKNLHFLYETKACTITAEPETFYKTLKIIVSTAIINSEKYGTINFSSYNKKDSTIITISYRGLPLTLEEQNRMFERKSYFSAVGHCLKMYLCKKIIEAHGGKISVGMKNGSRTTFTIKIPFVNKTKQAGILTPEPLPVC